MASQGLILKDLSDEALEALDLIKEKRSFLLSGGAGSGKTYSLVEIIKAVISINPLGKIACITYTNAAVKEIEGRVDHPNLHVSTIHEFLWRNIRNFQQELKDTIIELIKDDDCHGFKIPGDEEPQSDFFDELDNGIQYKEFVRLKDGIISHDELIVLACQIYKKYKKICLITKDSFPYIFVDEYQDSNKEVVEILLEHLKKSDKVNVVGFFGDAMQSIYEGSIGNLDGYKGDSEGQVKEVKKEQNRRNPRLIINLANNLRNDGLTQHPSDDVRAPNMGENCLVKNGTIKFLYSTDGDLTRVRNYLGWDFSNSEQTKELNLTHNLISGKAGFEELMRIYDGDKILDYVRRVKKYIKDNSLVIDTEGRTFGDVVDELVIGKVGRELNKLLPTKGMNNYIVQHNVTYKTALTLPYDEISSIYLDKDQLIDDKKNYIGDESKVTSSRDDLIKHLFKIQHNVRLYQENRVNEFIRVTDYQISSMQARAQLKVNIEALVNVGDRSIDEIISEADKSGIVKIDDRLQRFRDKKCYVYMQVAALPFKQFQNLYEYLEGFTPFSTQHKTKGAEFENVLLVLDNGNWSSYNFEYLMNEEKLDELTSAKKMSFPNILDRTQKLFYVCCTRAKDNLAVYYHNPSDEVILKAREWFGIENVIDSSRFKLDERMNQHVSNLHKSSVLDFRVIEIGNGFQCLAFKTDPGGSKGKIYYGYISKSHEEAISSTKAVITEIEKNS